MHGLPPDHVAAEFLKPKKFLAREAYKYSLRVLARRHLISMQAMEIRFKELGLVCKDMRGVI